MLLNDSILLRFVSVGYDGDYYDSEREDVVELSVD